MVDNSIKTIKFNSYSAAVEFYEFNKSLNYRTHFYFLPVQQYADGVSGDLIWAVQYYRLGGTY